MIQPVELGNVWVGHGVQWTAVSIHGVYEHAVRAWTEAGFPPDRIGARAPGIGAGYGSFKRKRRYFKPEAFKEMESLEIVCLENGRTNEMIDWAWSILANKHQNTVVVSWDPALICGNENYQVDIINKIMIAMGVKYGYAFQQPKALGPLVYALGILYGSARGNCQRHGDLEQNICDWSYHKVNGEGGAILRDIYPENILGIPHQQAPVGRSGQSLREWIETSSASRGTLEPVAGGLLSWKPPVQNIPLIREILYRAGRVFYWKFMKPQYFDPAGTGKLFDEPLYRPDLSAPWEAEGPTPEIFTAEFYKDKDPGLTY